MTDSSAKKWVIVDGILHDESEFYDVLNSREAYAYEVIRVIDGKPLLVEEHVERFDRTLEGLGAENTLTSESVREDIAKLFTANNVLNDNVKIIFLGGRMYMKLVGAEYPSESEYRNGVKVGTLRAMRVNPQAKVSDSALRELADRRIAESDVYEVLLLDREGCVTEGSRSNVFFIKDGTVFTSPAEGVLLGITRQMIVKLCEDNGIPVVEKKISEESFGDYDAAFISGTSPKVLPIRCITNEGETNAAGRSVMLSTGEPTLRRIMELYDRAVEENISKE